MRDACATTSFSCHAHCARQPLPMRTLSTLWRGSRACVCPLRWASCVLGAAAVVSCLPRVGLWRVDKCNIDLCPCAQAPLHIRPCIASRGDGARFRRRLYASVWPAAIFSGREGGREGEGVAWGRSDTWVAARRPSPGALMPCLHPSSATPSAPTPPALSPGPGRPW